MNSKIITNAKILTMSGETIENGFILIENSKIKQVGKMENLCKKCDDVIDANGGYVTPGFIEAHCHIGLYEDSLGFEGEDGNEDTDPITPHMQVVDGINPMERAFSEARKAGVTTVMVSPGSANIIGGQMAIIKTVGRRVDDMIVRAPAAMKFALGENPKSVYHDKDQTPVTRMATAALLREHLTKSKEYANHIEQAKHDEDKDEPDYDAKLHAMLPVLDGSIPAHFHAHRADDIFTALRICKEFSLKPVIIHGTEGHLIADILAEEDISVISGPFVTDRSKPELSNLSETNPAILHSEGVKLALTTDHPEFPVKFILDSARIAVRNGLNSMQALKSITIDAADILNISDRVGSIEVGKDADLVLFTGDPFEYTTKITAVLCEGKLINLED